ncbi:hypothetical protein Tco_0169620 [Tanacetum coccineum]
MGNDSLRQELPKARVLGLQVLFLELNHYGNFLLGEREEGQVSIVMGGIFSIEARDMDMKLLSAPESNNTLARCWFRRNIDVTTFVSWHRTSNCLLYAITSSGWPFVSAVLGQMAHVLASIILQCKGPSVNVDAFLTTKEQPLGYVNGFLLSLRFGGGACLSPMFLYWYCSPFAIVAACALELWGHGKIHNDEDGDNDAYY